MRKYGDYLWTVEKRDGGYRALVFERAGAIMVAVGRGFLFSTNEKAEKSAKSIIDRAMRARDHD